MNAATPALIEAHVQLVALADLVPNPRNARQHPEEQVTMIADLIREYGFTNPMLADLDDGGVIIAGHGRRLAVLSIEAAGETIRLPNGKALPAGMVPVIDCSGWSEKQRRAYTLADNASALSSTWDDDLLKLELGELRDEGFDLALTGFGSAEIEALLEASGGGDEGDQGPKANLAERFGIAPFSVLNAREGWWQDRKRAWLSLGIQSEVGRGENLLAFSDTVLEPDPKKRAAKAAKRVEKTTVVAGKGWGEGGPARRDAAFYAKKRAWEKANGRQISTTEFREKHWDGAA